MSKVKGPKLLVSVRNATEALTAFAGGAAIIDVKEPSRGSLGRADAPVIEEVLRAVDGRVPVSAALGEWIDETNFAVNSDLGYVKWGLAGCWRRSDWRPALSQALKRVHRPQLVVVAYADAECAQAPSVEDVVAFAADHPGGVLLLDTHCKIASLGKPRPTLLDWLPVPWIENLCERCHNANVKIALAGSIGQAEIHALRNANPDWFAVRGAVCDENDRAGTVQLEKVQQLVAALNSSD